MAATLAQIEKLLDAGYSKDEIEKMTAEQPEPEAEDKEPKAEDKEPEEKEPEKEAAPDPMADYKDKLDSAIDQLDKLTKQIQKNNVRYSSQGEPPAPEKAGDILYKTIANIIPPPGKEE